MGDDRGVDGNRGVGEDPERDAGRGGAGSGAGIGADTGAAEAAQSLWTKSFVVISLFGFLSAVVFLLLVVVMSKVATDRFGASPAVAGLSASIFVIGAFVTRPVLGKRIHRFGQTRTLYVGAFLSVILTLAYFAADSIGMLLLVRFLHGAAHATAALASGTIVAGIVPRRRYGEGIGYFTLGQTLATAIGPFLGLLLLEHGGFDAMIITCSVVSAVALLLLPLLGVKDLQLTAEQRAETQGFKLSNYIEPKAVPIGLAIMLSFLCNSSVSSFLALYAEETGLTASAGAFFIVNAIVVFFSRPLVGRRFDTRGENSVMYAAIVVFAVGLAVLAVASHGAVLLLSSAIMGVGFGSIQSCGRALTIKVTPLHRMGQATSTFYVFGDTGLGLGPLLCGFLIPFTGYRGMYGVMAGIAMATLFVYHVLHGRHTGAAHAGPGTTGAST